MEPRSSDRGEEELANVVEAHVRFQWSRDPLIAESRSSAKRWAVSSTVFQWSRDPLIAERVRRWSNTRWLSTVSMEPRSSDRGEPLAVSPLGPRLPETICERWCRTRGPRSHRPQGSITTRRCQRGYALRATPRFFDVKGPLANGHPLEGEWPTCPPEAARADWACGPV